MSLPDTPVDPANEIQATLATLLAKQSEQTDAINATGALVQWIVDNVKDVFAFFGSPQMLGMMGQLGGGMMPPAMAQQMTQAQDLTGDTTSDDTASEPAGPEDGPASGGPAPF
jgi:hypothetical protein